MSDAPSRRRQADDTLDEDIDIGAQNLTSSDSEREHFAELYRLHRDPLFTFCLARTHDAAVAEDVVQQVFTEAFALRARFDPRRSFWSWLASIAARECIDIYRRHSYASSRIALLVPAPASDDDPTAAAVLDRMVHTRFDDVLARLPVRQRIAFHLAAVEGWSYSDVAAYFGTSIGTVRMLVFRARETVRNAGLRALAGVTVGMRAVQRRLQVVADRLAVGSWLWEGAVRTSLHGLSSHAGPITAVIAVIAGMAISTSVPSTGAATNSPEESSHIKEREDSSSVVTASDQAVPSSPTATPLRPPQASRSPLGGVEHAAHEAAAALLYQPGAGDSPEDASGYSIAVSPSYERDRTVFVSTDPGSIRGAAPLFVTHDGGATWVTLSPRGLQGPARLVLPPSYPKDGRIFAFDGTGLRVSVDGGRSFETLVPFPDIYDVVASPLYDRGDPSLLVLAGGRLFGLRVDTLVLQPLELGPGLAGHLVLSARYGLGYPSDGTVLLLTQDTGKKVDRWFHRCRQEEGLGDVGAAAAGAGSRRLRCAGRAMPPSSRPDAWTVLVSPRLRPGLVYVGSHLSTDEGATFQRVVDDQVTQVYGIDAIPSSDGLSAVMARQRVEVMSPQGPPRSNRRWFEPTTAAAPGHRCRWTCPALITPLVKRP